jgi:hypothetical protein
MALSGVNGAAYAAGQAALGEAAAARAFTYAASSTSMDEFVGDVSWLGLIAKACVGEPALSVRKAVFARDLPRGTEAGQGDPMWLVVQSYAPEELSDSGEPAPRARPRASAQRVVTREELLHGVEVSLVELTGSWDAGDEDGVVVAWVEPAGADLEFGGFEARPSARVMLGLGRTRDGAPVVLRRPGG